MDEPMPSERVDDGEVPSSDARERNASSAGGEPVAGAGNGPAAEAAAAGTPRAVTDESPSLGAIPASGSGVPEPTRADMIIRGLGYCGHFLHFHGGGRSGREPILCLLHCMGGTMSQQEVGARFELKPGSLSEILAKVETAGLIERTRDPKDRRQLFIHLTEAGEREAQRAVEARQRFRSKAFSNLTVEEQDQLIELLDKVRERWEELAC